MHADEDEDLRPQSLTVEATKAMLQRRLEDLASWQKDINTAIGRLDAGEAPRAVLRDLPMVGARFGERRGALRGRLEEPREGRAPRGDRGPEGPGDDGTALDDRQKDRQRLMRVLRDELPEIANGLEELRRKEPRTGERLIERMMPRLRQTVAEKPRDEELFRLRISEMRSMFVLMRAARAARLANEAAQETVPDADLRAAVENAFDDRLAVQRREADLLERRVRDLREDISAREKDKAKLVDEGVERILIGGTVMPQGEPGPGHGPMHDEASPPPGGPPR
jgi:hypothetical protein